MNINSLSDKLDVFQKLVVKSGFSRDLADYISAVQQAQNRNLVFMKDISLRVTKNLDYFDSFNLSGNLEDVLLDSTSFTELETRNEIYEINNDPEITTNEYYSRLIKIIQNLMSNIDENITEYERLKNIFDQYLNKNNTDVNQADEDAIVSLLLKDEKSISSIKQFQRTIHVWDRTLKLYYNLIKGESPDEIKLVTIQQGSIDFIFNIDFDVAINLAELFEAGVKGYIAYLTYKSEVGKKFLETFKGNKKLEKQEEDRDKLMLDNIEDIIERKIKEQILGDQDNSKLKPGEGKKVKVISEVISEHIIKGNEIKLLNPPIADSKEGETSEERDDVIELTQLNAEVSRIREMLPEETKTKLIERYIKEEYLIDKLQE